jgi:hypothetical protein
LNSTNFKTSQIEGKGFIKFNNTYTKKLKKYERFLKLCVCVCVCVCVCDAISIIKSLNNKESILKLRKRRNITENDEKVRKFRKGWVWNKRYQTNTSTFF